MNIYSKKFDVNKKSRDRVKAELVCELNKLGYASYLQWNEFIFSASVGWGIALRLEGVITEDEIIINTCSGGFNQRVLEQIKTIIDEIA